MAKVDVTVSIVNFRTFDLTSACIKSVLSRTRGIACEVIVVDNHSADGSAEKLSRLFKSRITLITNSHDVGFAAANNQALNLARGKYFVMLNSDTRLLNNAFQILAAFMDRNSDCAVSGPALFNPDGTCQKSYSNFKTPFQRALWEIAPALQSLGLMKNQSAEIPLVLPAHPIPVDRPRGVCFFVRGSFVDRVGKLDEGFFMYDEEVDWAYRFQKAGYKNYFVPDAEILHHGGASSRNPILAQIHTLSDYRYYQKHYGLYASLLIRAFALGASFLWLVVFTKHLLLNQKSRLSSSLYEARSSLGHALIFSPLINWQSLKRGT